MRKLDPKIPVFANTRPWNELVLQGVRSFKTLHFPWKYRGTIYLYDTQGKPADYGYEWAEDHGVDVAALLLHKGFPGCIVGTVDVFAIRSFSTKNEEANHELLLQNPMRFARAVKFPWPSGAIRIARIKQPT